LRTLYLIYESAALFIKEVRNGIIKSMDTSSKKGSISIIAAIQKDRGLGYKNELLWRIPRDLKRFKRLTEEHNVIMGSKTYESIGHPLPNRKNIVLSRDKDLKIDGVEVAHTLKEAIELSDEGEIFVIGGAQIYEVALPFADKLHLTIIEGQKPADAFFPDYINDFTKKTLIEKREHEGIEYSFIDFER
jgi:dihydrofolate reductase